MNFEDYLTESLGQSSKKITYESVDGSRANIIKQEINRGALKIALNSEFIAKSEDNNKIIDLEYYIDGVGLDKDDVVIRGACIVETTEDGGNVYYKPVGFEYNLDKNKLYSVDDNTDIAEENWKTVQSTLLKSFKKI